MGFVVGVVLDCVEQPELGFDLKFLGGDVAALPGVEKLIDVSCYLLSKLTASVFASESLANL
jgi:hypothetical protein